MTTRRIRVGAFFSALLLLAMLALAAGCHRAASRAATPADQTAPAPAAKAPPAPCSCPEANPAPGRPAIYPCQIKNCPGLHNLGQVTDRLYRGAQPKSSGYKQLQDLGIRLVVNFRNQPDKIDEEEKAVRTHGMRYVSLPWSARRRPSNAQVAQFLQLVRDNPDTKIFVHCQAGADRTGTMVALFHIARQCAKPEDTRAEMHAFHYHHFFFPHLEKYVKDFPQRLRDDSQLRALQSPACLAAR